AAEVDRAILEADVVAAGEAAVGIADLVARGDAVAATGAAGRARREESVERQPEVGPDGVALGVEEHDLVDLALGDSEAPVRAVVALRVGVGRASGGGVVVGLLEIAAAILIAQDHAPNVRPVDAAHVYGETPVDEHPDVVVTL